MQLKTKEEIEAKIIELKTQIGNMVMNETVGSLYCQELCREIDILTWVLE